MANVVNLADGTEQEWGLGGMLDVFVLVPADFPQEKIDDYIQAVEDIKKFKDALARAEDAIRDVEIPSELWKGISNVKEEEDGVDRFLKKLIVMEKRWRRLKNYFFRKKA